MTTPAYTELVSAVRREGQSLLAAASMGTDTAVPSCGDWTVENLVRHVWQVYANVTCYVSTRATQRPKRLPEMPAGDPVALLADQLDELVTALGDCEPDTPIWTWVFDAPEGAVFWARRMAHKTAVNRFDAQIAKGIHDPIDAELASDGIDELVDIIIPRVYSRDDLTGPTGSVTLRATDGDVRHLELNPEGVRRVDRLEAPDVEAAGTSSALLLSLYGRAPIGSLEVTGDADLLERWTSAVSF